MNNNNLGLANAFNGKISSVCLERKWAYKLQIRETLTAASKLEWLVPLRISEITGKLWLKWVKNVVFRRFLTCLDRSPSVKRETPGGGGT